MTSLNVTGANISDEALLNLSVKDLNKLLKSLSSEDRNKLKKRRRILKNRGYAANCRTKRMSQKEILQMKKQQLEIEVRHREHTNEMLKLKLNSIKERYSDLKTYALLLRSQNKSLTSS
jgi:transcription factor MAFF/G/K